MKKKVKINLIAAIGENRELGKDGRLLWHIPEDLKRFRKLTEGNIVFMGRKTFASIGKKLPGRVNIIISRQKNLAIGGCLVFDSLTAGLAVAKKISQKKNKEIFIIGGESIYRQTINWADRLYLTIVGGKFAADVYFPDYSAFTKVVSEKRLTTIKYRLTYLELEKN